LFDRARCVCVCVNIYYHTAWINLKVFVSASFFLGRAPSVTTANATHNESATPAKTLPLIGRIVRESDGHIPGIRTKERNNLPRIVFRFLFEADTGGNSPHTRDKTADRLNTTRNGSNNYTLRSWLARSSSTTVCTPNALDSYIIVSVFAGCGPSNWRGGSV